MHIMINVIKPSHPDWDDFISVEECVWSSEHIKGSLFLKSFIYLISEEDYPEYNALRWYWESNTVDVDEWQGWDYNDIEILYRVEEKEDTAVMKKWVRVAEQV